MPPHSSPMTKSCIIDMRGRLGAVIFNEDGTIREKAVLEPGGPAVAIDVPHGTFHTLVALEPDTVFFEAKAGPYRPLESPERAAWAPQEGHPQAREYLSALVALFS
jgi:cupin fold WbuC family metalloprotein